MQTQYSQVTEMREKERSEGQKKVHAWHKEAIVTDKEADFHCTYLEFK